MLSCIPHLAGFPWRFSSIIFVIIFSVLAYTIIKFLIRKREIGNHNNDKGDSLEILKKRLAQGEITIEEFERLKGYL